MLTTSMQFKYQLSYMTPEEKGEAFRNLFLISDFAQYLSNKRNKTDFMDAPNSYSILFNTLSDEDLESLQNSNVRFGMIVAPASQITLPVQNTGINLICFEKHCLNLFDKNEVVSIILHEIGHVFNPNLEGDEHEFLADDYAVARGYANSIISSLRYGIELNIPGFNQAINQRRIVRLQQL